MASAGGFDAGMLGGGPPAPSGGGVPTTTVELTLRCTGLAKSDLLSKSDPMCVVFTKDSSSGNWREAGRTEVMADTHEPAWSTKVTLDYNFEARQPVKLEVWDADSSDLSGPDLGDHELLGRVETSLAAIVSAPCKQFAAVLRAAPNAAKSKIFVNVEEVRGGNDLVQIQFCASDLDKKDTFGKSDPYYVINKSAPSGQFVVVHRSEVVMNNLSPTWKPVNLTMRELCSGDPERPLKIDVYDWDSNTDHDYIGSFKTNFRQLEAGVAEKTKFEVINRNKEAKKKHYKNSGTISLKYFQVIERHSFVDYLQGGTAMNFSVAVDFTASNGNPHDPASLHFRQPGTGENQYTQAIRAVGEIIEEYDADRQFPALGFGAKIPPNFGIVSHEFFLNLEHGGSPYCHGVEGILQAYDKAQRAVQQYGPTYFTPIIQHVARFASAYQDGAGGKQYFVLLILTDGIITDLDETKAAIVEASTLPLSIIIVGVGDEDFEPMNALDSDGGLLRAGARVAARDIVQFVEMRKFVRTGGGGGYDKALLAKHVLAEIPKQVVGWMTIRGIKPAPALQS